MEGGNDAPFRLQSIASGKQMRKTPIYLLEKFTGLVDSNGVELWYTFAARLTRNAAESDYQDSIATGQTRVRKIVATK